MAHGIASTMSPWARRTLISAAVLLLLYLGGRVTLTLLLDPERVVAALSERSEAVLGTPLAVDRARTVLLPPSLRLTGVSLFEADSDPERAGTRMERVDLKVAFLPLFRAEVRLRGMEARRVSTEIPVTPRGDALLGLELDRLRLRRGGRAGDGAYRGSAEGRATPGSLPGIPVRAAFDLRIGEQEATTLHVGPGLVHLGEIPLELLGTLRADEGGEPTLVAELWGERLPLKELLELFPSAEVDKRRLSAEGTASVRLRWAGEWSGGARPDLRGDLGVQAEIVQLGDAMVAEAVGMEMTLLPELALEGSARATFLGGPGEVGGRVELAGERPQLDLSFQGTPTLDATTLLGLLPGGMGGEGRLGAAVRVRGPVGDPTAWRLDGNLFPREVLLTSPEWSGALEIPGGSISLEDGRARIDALPVALRGNSLTVNGEIPNLMAHLGSDSLPPFQGTIRRR